MRCGLVTSEVSRGQSTDDFIIMRDTIVFFRWLTTKPRLDKHWQDYRLWLPTAV
jgi:hypothetical protein